VAKAAFWKPSSNQNWQPNSRFNQFVATALMQLCCIPTLWFHHMLWDSESMLRPALVP
jgi:hypothetical protein